MHPPRSIERSFEVRASVHQSISDQIESIIHDHNKFTRAP